MIEYKEALDVAHILSKEVYSPEKEKVVEVAGIKQCDHIRCSTWSEKEDRRRLVLKMASHPSVTEMPGVSHIQICT